MSTTYPKPRRFAVPLGGSGHVFVGWLLRVVSWLLFAFVLIEVVTCGELEDPYLLRQTKYHPITYQPIEESAFFFPPMLHVIASVLSFGAALWLVRRGGELISSGKAVHWYNSERPEVLMLRSFRDDRLGTKENLWFIAFKTQFEEEIARVIRAETGYKSLIALQNPLDSSTPLGFTRALAEDDEWKEAVVSLSEQARLVVVIALGSPGLDWELDHLDTSSKLARTLVLFPPNDLEERWKPICALKQFQLARIISSDLTMAKDYGFVRFEEQDDRAEFFAQIGGFMLSFDDPAPPTVWGQQGYDRDNPPDAVAFSLLLRRALIVLRDPLSVVPVDP